MIRKLVIIGWFLIATTLDAATVPPPQADRIVIQKSARQLSLLRNGKVFRMYRVCLGSNPVGAKEREGDGKTPEGIYRIDSRNASSLYHRACMFRIRMRTMFVVRTGCMYHRAARS